MNSTTSDALTEEATTWVSVVQLLFAAAERGFEEATTAPHRHSTAIGSYTAAATALALLPEELEFDDDTAAGDMAALLLAADREARRPPRGTLPSGASQVIAALQDLIRETRR